MLGNTIRDCGRHYWHATGILIFQSGGNRIAHNILTELPYTGIVLTGVNVAAFNPANKYGREMTSTIRHQEIDIRGKTTLSRVKSYLHTRNNHIEYNEIHNVMQVLGDGNGIYVRFTGPGNIIRRNYVHHVLAAGANAGIRCDDSQTDTEIYENVIYKCTKTGVMIKGTNTIHNNLLVDILTTDHPDNIHQVPFWGYFGYLLTRVWVTMPQERCLPGM